jgi:hypothetical protein
MAEPLQSSKHSHQNPDGARRADAEHHQNAPTEPVNYRLERAPSRSSLHEDIRARANRPHKGDVGREGTNEEVYQGSKQRELP